MRNAHSHNAIEPKLKHVCIYFHAELKPTFWSKSSSENPYLCIKLYLHNYQQCEGLECNPFAGEQNTLDVAWNNHTCLRRTNDIHCFVRSIRCLPSVYLTKHPNLNNTSTNPVYGRWILKIWKQKLMKKYYFGSPNTPKMPITLYWPFILICSVIGPVV